MTAWIPLLIALAVFLAVTGVVVLAVSIALSRRRERLSQRLTGSRNRDGAAGVGDGRSQWLSRMADRGQRLDQMLEDPEETTILLAQAGWRGARARGSFYAVQVLLPIGSLVAAFPLWFLLHDLFGPLQAGLLLVGLLIISVLLPRMVLRSMAKRRRKRLRNEVPLFINLIILLFEAGLSSRQALASLVQDGSGTLPEITSELRPVLRQIEAGGDTGTLLFEMSKTLDVAELESVLGILRQVEKYGGEVREPLTEALANIEERRSLEIRERVNLMSGQMTVVLVLCFLPALLVMIVGPAFTSILSALNTVGTS